MLVVVDVLSFTTAVDAGISVEAAAALATLVGIPDVAAAIRGCVSGRELIERGFEADVEIATEVGAAEIVPVLHKGVFSAAPN